MELEEVITELQSKIELNNKIIKIIPNTPDVSGEFVKENELFKFIINVLQKIMELNESIERDNK